MAPRLLVLDDEPDLLLLYQLILEPEGYLVHLATSGFEQVADIEHFQPDLLILDYRLSLRHGAESLLHQLKAYPPTAALPVILCTADAYAVYDLENFLRAHHVGMLLIPGVASITKTSRCRDGYRCQMLSDMMAPVHSWDWV
jgi:two-component system response regulator VicR